MTSMNRKVSLEAFISENSASSSSKKESKLMPFKTEIAELKSLGYTLDQIVEYLRLNDLIVGRSTVVYFIRNHIEKKQNNLQKNSRTSKASIDKVEIKLDIKNSSKPISEVNESKPSAFNWQTPIAKEDLF